MNQRKVVLQSDCYSELNPRTLKTRNKVSLRERERAEKRERERERERAEKRESRRERERE